MFSSVVVPHGQEVSVLLPLRLREREKEEEKKIYIKSWLLKRPVVGLLDLGNGLSRVEALGTNLGAVHDGLAPGRFCGDETKNARKKTRWSVLIWLKDLGGREGCKQCWKWPTGFGASILFFFPHL